MTNRTDSHIAACILAVALGAVCIVATAQEKPPRPKEQLSHEQFTQDLQRSNGLAAFLEFRDLHDNRTVDWRLNPDLVPIEGNDSSGAVEVEVDELGGKAYLLRSCRRFECVRTCAVPRVQPLTRLLVPLKRGVRVRGVVRVLSPRCIAITDATIIPDIEHP